MTRLRVPGHIQESPAPHGGSVLLDLRSGHCFAMNPTARALWQEWSRGQDLDSTVRLLGSSHPGSPREQISQDVRRFADELIRRGLLTTDDRNPRTRAVHLRTPAPRGPAPVPAAPPAHHATPGQDAPRPGDFRATAETATAATPPRTDSRAGTLRTVLVTAAGLLGLLVALLVIRLPFHVVLRLAGWTVRTWCWRDATPHQATASLSAVRRAAGLYPGRAACLEESLATLVVLALTGRRAHWCLGTAHDPHRFHAWVETRGVPVVLPGEDFPAGFRRVLST
ncbi:lasso peptide biosynthesis B2 protein [Streptomyces prasinus]|uniref:lasso peptide biosynthesis B2 protein n=1 Tax=Streptomyces prasinus TaxID=67345 RepID=UPI00363CEE52